VGFDLPLLPRLPHQPHLVQTPQQWQPHELLLPLLHPQLRPQQLKRHWAHLGPHLEDDL